MRAGIAGWLALQLACIACARGQEILQVDLPVNSLGFSAQTGMLYATVPSTAGVPYGNCLVEISPDDGSLTRSIWVGSEPNSLSVSRDAPVAHLGLSGAAAVRSVDLDKMEAGIQFSLGLDYFFGPLFPAQVAVMPGSPQTVAVSKRNVGFSPWFEGVAIYDSGVMRPQTAGGNVASNSIAFGSDPAVLFGMDNQDTAGSLTRMGVSESGITYLESIHTPFAANVIVADGVAIFGDYGDVADGATLQTVGHYDASGVEVIVGPTHSVIFAKDNTVRVYQRFSHTLGPDLTILWEYGAATSAAACGVDCLAVAYDSGNVLIIKGYNGVVFATDFE